jgi:circadian clock protein KaiC
VIVAGPPGSGKTILAQQICFANATGERRALYHTTWSEPHDKLIRHLEPFSFFDADALGERVEFLHLAELMASEGGGLNAVSEEILRHSFEARPAVVVVVVDSSKALHDVVDPDELRRAIYDLASRVAHSDAVLILVGEYSAEETRSQPEFTVADGILQLETRRAVRSIDAGCASSSYVAARPRAGNTASTSPTTGSRCSRAWRARCQSA